jgi:ElaB/YqjD/DUF883 family membrane-anchored ribosome-binding protein
MNQEFIPAQDHAAAATDAASNALHRAGDQTAALAQRGADAMHRGADALQRGSGELQARARRMTDDTTAYIQREPTKAVLIAAATGATLMALLTLLTRSAR